MDDALLAWRNVWRNPRRSILTLLAVAFAAALLIFMLSFQFGSYDEMINASVRLSTGHLQIQAPGYNNKQEMRQTVSRPGDVINAVYDLEGVSGISQRSETFVLAASETRTQGVMVMGIDPVKEPTVSTLANQIDQGRYLQAGDRNSAIIGTLLAKRLKVTVGDELTLLGQGRDGSVAATVVKVVGIYRAGIDAFDRSTMQITLADFNDTFFMAGTIHRIVMITDTLKSAQHLKDTMRSIPALNDLKILGWEELTPGLKQSIQLDMVSGFIMYFILIIVVGFSILNTFFMAIFERTREFGMLMAIGTKPGRLVRLMLTESMFIASLGLIMGMLLGVAVTLYFTHVGIGLGEAGELMTQYGISDRLYPHLSWLSLLTGPAIVMMITFLAALFPAFKIPRLKPVDALVAV